MPTNLPLQSPARYITNTFITSLGAQPGEYDTRRFLYKELSGNFSMADNLSKVLDILGDDRWNRWASNICKKFGGD
jgi:hypothetical protein